MPIRLDIAIQRNEAYAATWTLTDDTGAPIDLTGKTLKLQVKARLDNSAIIQSADIDITDAAAGECVITLRADAGHALHTYGGSALQTFQLPYDLVLIDEDGLPLALTAGYVIVSRGVSS